MKKAYLFLFLLCSISLHAQHQVNQQDYGPFQQIATAQPKQTQGTSSVVVKPVDEKMLSNQTEEIGRQIRRAGFATLGIGSPIAIAGAACLIYGFQKYSTPIDGYTTDANEAAKVINLKLITTEEYAKKAAKAAEIVEKHENGKIAGYVLLSVGGAITLVSIPIIVAGNHIMDMTLKYGTNGVGVAINY